MNFKLFRLDCTFYDASKDVQVNTTVYLNPKFVVSIEHDRSVTVIETTTKRYFTRYLPEVIIKGLESVARMNGNILNLN